jgi:DNA-binding transcriptional LysR family regulator
MNIVQIETFYWAARLGSFQAAAERLATTQPGISMRIRQLEQSLGVELFDRTGRTARLTPKGRELVEEARDLLAIADRIRERIGDHASLAGRLRLGVVDSIALTWLPELLARIRTTFPKLDIELEVHQTFPLLGQLAQRDIDLAIVAGPVDDPQFAVTVIHARTQGWFAAPRLTRRGGAALTPHDLAELPVLTYTRGSHQHQTILRWFQAAGAMPRRLTICSSLATIVRLGAAGLGICLQTPQVLARELAAGELVPLATTLPVPDIEYAAAHLAAEGAVASRMVASLAAEVGATATQRTAGAGRSPAPGRRRGHP